MKRPLDLRWVADTLKDPPPEPAVLVEGMLRGGELCVVGASRAVGKSWLVLNLAVLLSRGEGHLMGNLPVWQSVPVLYANGELDSWASAARYGMLLGGEEPGLIAETFEPWRLEVRRVRATSQAESGARTEEWFEGVLDARIESAVAQHGFATFIIDPWATFYAGDENSNDQAEAALGQLRGLALRHGVAIVIVHHLGKASDARDPEDLWRGASRLADWASTRVTLLPHFSERTAQEAGLSPVEARRYVDVRFLRRHEPTDPFSSVLGRDGWWRAWRPDEGPRPVTRLTVNDVVEACRRSGGRWKSVSEARSALGTSKEATATLLREAVDMGRLVQEPGVGSAKSFRLAENGSGMLDLDEERRRRERN
ncbi:MAG: AAA family ATPase [Acidimicrobiales bacterium]